LFKGMRAPDGRKSAAGKRKRQDPEPAPEVTLRWHAPNTDIPDPLPKVSRFAAQRSAQRADAGQDEEIDIEE
jgi:hypothetical protein